MYNIITGVCVHFYNVRSEHVQPITMYSSEAIY